MTVLEKHTGHWGGREGLPTVNFEEQKGESLPGYDALSIGNTDV